ncbi:sensor histidine kinase [Herminiimonas fonticola]|uniref:histidine kinase n=1 Tax=Herminiimonas fonticola TaxID=303380 RepID=A0A4V3BUL2_9BURK|nr:ATP-binding protein [Herminiimonas fonticola]RBA22888.1 Histidine kinase-, DNA gyrase B-, and HSP90-like ATPase [Herminiimonas fonticola]TDN87688.1 phospho-acceptor domain-containing protein [Herminiimonas fonticola]
MINQFLHFDREVPLAQSLKIVSLERLESALTQSIGNRWNIVDTEGAYIIGPAPKLIASPDMIAVPLRMDIEIVGQLMAQGASRTQLETACKWLEMVLAASSRYRMAADLHLEAIHSDFEMLQQKHEALQESERQYRELSAELNERVQSQVAAIEKAQRQVYQAEKMASVGSLAAGMAHEINNPIGFIRSNLSTASGYVDLLVNAIKNPGREGSAAILDVDFVVNDFPGLLAESISGANRIAHIVANLKAFSNIDCMDDGPIDLNEVIQTVAAVVGDQMPPTISLSLDLQPLDRIAGDRGQMSQMLFSILQNAQQALTEKGGQILVSSKTINAEIRIAVNDDGVGIQSDILNRIFDPFFTTRDVGKGTGLGLTVSRDIALAHGGRIQVESEEGRGSTFTLIFPLSDQIKSDTQEGLVT